MKLDKYFYTRNNVVEIARDLLGKTLVTKIDNIITSGIIVETEAYNGIYDKACHAYGNRKTERTKVMYEEGGVSYVYFCYGMHYLFNVVTNKKDIPDAVLIRSVIPYDGKEYMFQRISEKSMKKGILNGPGKITKALHIDKSFNAESLLGDRIWMEDIKIKVYSHDILSTPRIGVDYAGKDALLPYRFILKDEKLDEIKTMIKSSF
ncbi:MAG: DNA-3-methyladenine glycosylase [Bacteroidia bacterium]|nr:DNA-3-methyladenine glycosylase [Bacteroidia bacterium]